MLREAKGMLKELGDSFSSQGSHFTQLGQSLLMFVSFYKDIEVLVSNNQKTKIDKTIIEGLLTRYTLQSTMMPEEVDAITHARNVL